MQEHQNDGSEKRNGSIG